MHILYFLIGLILVPNSSSLIFFQINHGIAVSYPWITWTPRSLKDLAIHILLLVTIHVSRYQHLRLICNLPPICASSISVANELPLM